MSSQIILITGANGVLGQAIARSFLAGSPSSCVWLGINRGRARADELAALNPDRCRIVALDVCDPTAWKSAVDKVTARDQRLDVLVNNAGVHEDALLAMMRPDSWERVLRVNLDGVFHGCQAVLPTMIGQRAGRIINISSISALFAPAGQTNYAAAKAGVLALTQSLAKEVARLGITVNAICPGYIDTEALAKMDEGARNAAIERVPMRRLGKPSEVAAAVCFLSCAEAGYITGSALKIDGGIF